MSPVVGQKGAEIFTLLPAAPPQKVAKVNISDKNVELRRLRTQYLASPGQPGKDRLNGACYYCPATSCTYSLARVQPCTSYKALVHMPCAHAAPACICETRHDEGRDNSPGTAQVPAIFCNTCCWNGRPYYTHA